MFRLLGTLAFAAALVLPNDAACQAAESEFDRSERVAGQVLGATVGSAAGLMGGFVLAIPLYQATGQPVAMLTAPLAATLLAAAGAKLGGRGVATYDSSLGGAFVGGMAAAATLLVVGQQTSDLYHWAVAWAIPQGLITGLLADRGIRVPRGPLLPPY